VFFHCFGEVEGFVDGYYDEIFWSVLPSGLKNRG
jgi:hypothetical protein